MYFVKKNKDIDKLSEIIFLNPLMDNTYVGEKLKTGELIKLSEYFFELYYPKYEQHNFYFEINYEITFENVCQKIKKYLNLYSGKELNFWYKTNNWYMLIEAKDFNIKVDFICSFSVDKFNIQIIDLNTEVDTKYGINIKLETGHLNNFIYFVNNLEKEFNNKRFEEEGYILEKQKTVFEDKLWRDYFIVNNDDKFGMAISYMLMEDLADKLFGIFCLNMLLQIKMDYVLEKFLEKNEYIQILLSFISLPLELPIPRQLVERTLFSLNVLSIEDRIRDEIMKNKKAVSFFNNANKNSNKDLSVIKKETQKILTQSHIRFN